MKNLDIAGDVHRIGEELKFFFSESIIIKNTSIEIRRGRICLLVGIQLKDAKTVYNITAKGENVHQVMMRFKKRIKTIIS